MRKVMVESPTYRQAVMAWELAQKKIPWAWTKVRKNPLMLECAATNTTYYFCSYAEENKLYGFYGEIHSLYDFEGAIEKGEMPK